MNNSVRSIAKNASVIAFATSLSRVLGFFRDVTIAFALGAGPLADAFFVAFRIPNLLRRLTAEGSLNMAFVPVFTQVRQHQGLDRAFLFARSVFLWLFAVLLVVTCIAILGAESLTTLIAPGFRDSPELFAHTVMLVRICFPYIILISGVALCMGILNSMGHFFAPAIAPCLLNIILIVSALLGLWMDLSISIAMSVGVLLAGIAQFALQQPFLWQKGFHWHGKWDFKLPELKRLGRIFLPAVGGAAVYQLNILVVTVLASFLASGSVSYLYYADRLVQLPLGVFGIALGTAALPSLSSLVSSKEHAKFRETLKESIYLNLFISLPAAAGLIGLGGPIVELLFGRGAFGMSSVSATYHALIGYSLGLPALCCIRSLIPGFYAFEDARTPVLIACVCLLVNISTAVLLMQEFAHVGLAVAVSVAAWTNFLLLGIGMGRKIGTWFGWDKSLPVLVCLSLLIGWGCWYTSVWGEIAVALIPVWAVLYIGGSKLFRVREAEMVIGILGKVVDKKKF